MDNVPVSRPARAAITRYRTIGVFNGYVPARRASERLVQQGISPTRMTVVVDDPEVPVDRARLPRYTFATLLGLTVGAVVGTALGGAAAGLSVGGADLAWTLAALYGLLGGALIGAPIGYALQRSFEKERKIPGAGAKSTGRFRLVVDPEEFDRAARSIRAPSTEQRPRGRSIRRRSPARA